MPLPLRWCVLLAAVACTLPAIADPILDDKWTPPTRPAAATDQPAPAKPAASRQPVPAPADLANSRRTILALYADDLAATTPPARKALALKLLGLGGQHQSTAGDQFMLLTAAYELAREAGDLATAFRAVDELDATYQIDAPAWRVAAATRANYRATLLRPEDAIVPALGLVDRLTLAEDFAGATAVIDALKAQCGATAAGLLKAREEALAGVRASADQYRAARAKLATAPDDPAASAAAGAHLCYLRGDWATGLPMLAKSADAPARAAALAELAKPAAAEAVCTVADRWWELAAGKSLAPYYKPGVTAHAADLYRQARPKLAGLRAVLVDRRLAEAGRATAGGGGDAEARRKLVFVVDCSGSMLAQWKKAQADLKKRITDPPNGKPFAILVDVEPAMKVWADGFTPAGDRSRNAAIGFLTVQTPHGSGQLAATLRKALELRPDELVVISDGDQNDWPAIHAAVAKANPGRRTRIHTSSEYTYGSDDGNTQLRKLATDNNGTFEGP